MYKYLHKLVASTGTPKLEWWLLWAAGAARALSLLLAQVIWVWGDGAGQTPSSQESYGLQGLGSDPTGVPSQTGLAPGALRLRQQGQSSQPSRDRYICTQGDPDQNSLLGSD